MSSCRLVIYLPIYSLLASRKAFTYFFNGPYLVSCLMFNKLLLLLLSILLLSLQLCKDLLPGLYRCDIVTVAVQLDRCSEKQYSQKHDHTVYLIKIFKTISWLIKMGILDWGIVFLCTQIFCFVGVKISDTMETELSQ